MAEWGRPAVSSILLPIFPTFSKYNSPGVLPPEVGRLSELKVLEADGNELEGEMCYIRVYGACVTHCSVPKCPAQ